nr:hypothetical protein [Tanacetum cinerariifolium]
EDGNPARANIKQALGSGFNLLVHSLRALSALRRSGMRTASTAAKPCQGDSLEFYLITGSIHTDQRGTVVLATLFNGSEQRHFLKALTDRQIVRLYKYCRMHTRSQGKKIGSCVHIEEPKEKRGMDFGEEARGVKHDGERVVPGSTVPVLNSEELAIKGLKEIRVSTWEMEWKEIMIST